MSHRPGKPKPKRLHRKQQPRTKRSPPARAQHVSRVLLPSAPRPIGLRFSEAGYPDFSPYAKTLPNGKRSVQITYTGSRSGDFAAANAAAGYKKTPLGFRWHHHEDMKTMLLVPADLHNAVPHTGGAVVYRHVFGLLRYGD